MKYTPSPKCYALIKNFEGCELTAYLCPAGIPSIGYGSTFYADGKHVKLGDRITQIQAEELLPKIVLKFSLEVNNRLKHPVTQGQFDALVSLCYNIGIGNFAKSTLLGLLNKGADKLQIASEFLKWNKSKGVILEGLIKRRNAERLLFLS